MIKWCQGKRAILFFILFFGGQGRNADALALYFGEDPARCPFEQGTLWSFWLCYYLLSTCLLVSHTWIKVKPQFFQIFVLIISSPPNNYYHACLWSIFLAWKAGSLCVDSLARKYCIMGFLCFVMQCFLIFPFPPCLVFMNMVGRRDVESWTWTCPTMLFSLYACSCYEPQNCLNRTIMYCLGNIVVVSFYSCCLWYIHG